MSAPFDSALGQVNLHSGDAPPEDDPKYLVEVPQLAASSFEDSTGSSSANPSTGSQDAPLSSPTTSMYSADIEISNYEATHYYAGVGPKGEGPVLIYRDSPDKFEEPSGPEAYTRLMRVVPVPDDHEFGKNGKWDRIRDHVVTLLDKRAVSTTSVDFVRFTWLDKKADEEVEDDDDDDDEDDSQDDEEEPVVAYDDIPRIQPVEDGKRRYTNATIWIGTTPGSLTSTEAHRSCGDIRGYLNSLNVENVDIAFRGSVYKELRGHGPALFPHV